MEQINLVLQIAIISGSHIISFPPFIYLRVCGHTAMHFPQIAERYDVRAVYEKFRFYQVFQATRSIYCHIALPNPEYTQSISHHARVDNETVL
jgi:hypothetical protein